MLSNSLQLVSIYFNKYPSVSFRFSAINCHKHFTKIPHPIFLLSALSVQKSATTVQTASLGTLSCRKRSSGSERVMGCNHSMSKFSLHSLTHSIMDVVIPRTKFRAHTHTHTGEGLHTMQAHNQLIRPTHPQNRSVVASKNLLQSCSSEGVLSFLRLGIFFLLF